VQGGIHCGRFIAQQIAAFETEWLAVEGGLQRLDKLHAMAERETKLMMALSQVDAIDASITIQG
jgi:hypothetical protein